MNASAGPINWASVTQKHVPTIVGFYYKGDDEASTLKSIIAVFKELERLSLDVKLPEKDYWARFTPMATDYMPCVVASTANELIDENKTIGYLLLNMWEALAPRRDDQEIILPAPSTNPDHWSIRKANRLVDVQPEWFIQDMRGIPVAGYSYNDGSPEWFAYIRLDSAAVDRIKQLKLNSNAK